MPRTYQTPQLDSQSAVWLPATGACWELSASEVHLWRVQLDVPAGELAVLHAALGDDEPERAERRIFERDRLHFIAARGTLRMLLGRYLDCAPQRLAFEYGSHGKPSLASAAGASRALEFNVAHSHGLALVAVTRGRLVGVDLERERDTVRHEALAQRCFSPAELRAFEAVPEPARRAFFFAAWARKESLLKATGRGLALPMPEVEVVADGQASGIVQAADAKGKMRSWRWQAVEPAPGYAGSVAAENDAWTLRCWHWTSSQAT